MMARSLLSGNSQKILWQSDFMEKSF